MIINRTTFIGLAISERYGWAVGFLVGAFVLSLFSIPQKIALNASPFEFKGFIVPVLFGGLVGTIIQINYKKRNSQRIERERLISELQHALEQVKQLGGLLPICANCKKIRDDQGYWNQIEEYIEHHSDATFSHSICPDCVRLLYPDYYEKLDG